MKTQNPAFPGLHNIVLQTVASWYMCIQYRGARCPITIRLTLLYLPLVLLVLVKIFGLITSPMNSVALRFDMESSHIAAMERTNIAAVGKPRMNSTLASNRAVFSSSDVVYPIVSIKRPGAVIVFLHIQKTGGKSFRHHLQNDTELGPCKMCRHLHKTSTHLICKCVRPQVLDLQPSYWLFSEYFSITNLSCRMHTDLTQLKIEGCTQQVLDRIEGNKGKERRYFYITVLRKPVARYISEFRHVQRGATWKGAKLLCKGRSPTAEEQPPCYQSRRWWNVTLDEFVSCPSNLAINRQTRMLADLTLVDCYNRSAMAPAERNRIMLASAKDNLRSMAFFGLTEYQRLSQYMFERTFNLTFVRPFKQNKFSESKDTSISHAQYRRILSLNLLDIELYKFAKDLFFQRFKEMSRRSTQRISQPP